MLCASFSASNLITGGSDGSVKFWSAKHAASLPAHTKPVSAVAVQCIEGADREGPRGPALAASGDRAGGITFWRLGKAGGSALTERLGDIAAHTVRHWRCCL